MNTFELNIKFKIYEEKNKYLVQIKQIYKKDIKNIDKNIIDNLMSKFPMNIKDISNLSLEIGFNINKGLFKIEYTENDFFIYFIKSIE